MAARHMAPPQQQQRKRKSPVVPILICIVVLAALGVGGFFAYQHFRTFPVTVNGQSTTVHAGDTVKKLLDEKLVTPKPGNLLAVDESVLKEGEGELCSVTINGNAADVNTPLVAKADVQIGDGADKMEESTTSEESIPFETDEGDRSFEGYWRGSIHLLSDGQEGKRVTRVGKESGKTVEESVTQPINAGYRIYTARPADRVVALTFDDGPWPTTTAQILDVLEANNAKATFFTIGNQIADNSEVLKRAANMGCEVCTHTWDHAAGSGEGVSIAKMSADEQVKEVQKGYEAITNVLGKEPKKILRAPGGNFYGDTISNLWQYVDAEIGWDVDTEDWRRPGTESIYNMIMSVQPGQVVLMHDGGGDRSQTVEAIKQAIPKLAEQGYKFVTVSELLEYGVPK